MDSKVAAMKEDSRRNSRATYPGIGKKASTTISSFTAPGLIPNSNTVVPMRKKCRPRPVFSNKENNPPKIRHPENNTKKMSCKEQLREENSKVLHHRKFPQKRAKQTFEEALNYDLPFISSASAFPSNSRPAISFILSPSVKRDIKESPKVNSVDKINSPKHPCPKMSEDSDEFEEEIDALPFIPSAPSFPLSLQPNGPCILSPPADEETENSPRGSSLDVNSLKRPRTEFPSIEDDLDELPDITKPVKKRARTNTSSKSEVHPSFNNKPIPNYVLKHIEQNPDTDLVKIFKKKILKNLAC